MKRFRKTIAILVALALLCAQIPLGMLIGAATVPGDNIATVQSVDLDGYGFKWVTDELDKDTTYVYEFNVVATEGNSRPVVVLRDPSGTGADGVYIQFRPSNSQIRIGGEHTTNDELITYATGITALQAAGTHAVKIVYAPESIQMWLDGEPVNFKVGSTVPIEKLTTGGGKAGFTLSGNVKTSKITDITVKPLVADEPEQPTEPVWDTENLVAGQKDITINNYDKHYLDATLDKDTGYRLDYTITFNTSVAGKWNNISNMLRESASDLISFGAWNDAGDGTGQLRFAENDISNAAHTAVVGTGGLIPAGVAFPISIVIMPDYVELYISGQLQTLYLAAGGTATRIPVSKRIENGQIGFIGQGSNPDITISDIALYAEAGSADLPTAPVWDTENLVAGQEDITINNYEKKYLDATLNKDTGYRLDYTITFNTSVAGQWNYVSNMLRESASDLISFGMWNDAGSGVGQLRFAENDISNNAHIAVMGTGGLIPAGVAFPISIVIMPDYVELYISGQLQTMYLASGATATRIPVSKRIEDGQIGFIGQGSNPDATISNIALYADLNTKVEEPEEIWTEIATKTSVTVDGSNPYIYQWVTDELDKESTYRIEYTLTYTDKIGDSNFASTAVRGIPGAQAYEATGLFMSHDNFQKVRFGDTCDTYSTLYSASGTADATATPVKYTIISAPDSVTVYVDDVLMKQYDFANGVDGQKSVAVPMIEGGRVGFRGFGANPNFTATDISVKVKGEAGGSEPDQPDQPDEPEAVWTEIATQTSVAVDGSNPYICQWVTDELDKESTYRIEYTLTYTDKIGDSNYASAVVRGIPGAQPYEATGLFMAHDYFQKIRFGDAYDTNTALYSAGGTADATATPVKYTIISAPDSVTVYVNDVLMKQYDFANGVDGQESVSVPVIEGGRVGFRGFGANPNFTATDISVKVKGEAGGSEPDQPDQPEAPVWGTENLVEGQDDITINNYEKQYLNATLDKHTGYRLDYTITFNTSVAGKWNFLSNMLRESATDLISFGIWNDAGDGTGQLRFAENDISNNAQIAVVGAGGLIPAGVAFPISIVIMPDYVELYIDGQLQTMYLTSGGTGTRIPVSKRIENGKIGFIGQGSDPDVTISNIALYADTNGADIPAVDQDAVNAVIAKIDAIGTVTKDSADAIAAARAAYDALKDEEKALVTNADILKAAETTLKQLTASQDMKLYALDGTYAMGYNHWGSIVSVSNANGGGMRFTWDNAGTNMRRGINRGVALDGLHLVASGLDLTSDNKAIAFYIADFDQAESYSQYEPQVPYFPLAIILNMNAGTIEVGNDPDEKATEVIATSDALKYENMKAIEWALNIEANGDGSYTVTVNGVSGVISKEILDKIECLKQLDYAFITVCPWSTALGAVSGSVDFLSLHGGGNACADSLNADEMQAVTDLIADIAAIGKVTADSKDVIAACEAAYAALNDVQKGCVTNYNALMAARYRYNLLTQEVDIPCINYYQISSSDTGGTNHWMANDVLSFENAAEGGVTFKWQNGGTNVRRFIDRKVTLDGLHMVLSNLSMPNGACFFAFYLADLYDTAADWTSLYSEYKQNEPTCAVLVFDAVSGSVIVQIGNESLVVLRDDRLTYEFLEGATWDIKVEKRDDGDYTLIANGAEGVIPAAFLDKATRLTDRDNEMYVTVSAWRNNEYLSYDLVAIHGGNVVCAEDLTEEMKQELNEVIDAIYAIYDENWQIQPSAEDAYNHAWDLYDALPEEIQALVANYSDLVVATDVLEVVLAIEDLGTITLKSGAEIEDVREMYKNLAVLFEEETGGSYQRVNIDTDRRLLVGNYATLDAAIRTYYNLYKEAVFNGTLPDDDDNDNDNEGDDGNGDGNKDDDDIGNGDGDNIDNGIDDGDDDGNDGDDNDGDGIDDDGDGSDSRPSVPDTGDSFPYGILAIAIVSLMATVFFGKKIIRKES